MNSDAGGQTRSDLQARTAQQIARKRVLAAYTEQAQKTAQVAERQAEDRAARAAAGFARAPAAVRRGYVGAEGRTGYANPADLREQLMGAQTTASEAAYSPVTNANNNNVAHLKDLNMQPQVNAESWQKYHSAWQEYYQKYYSEYYSNAARDYIAKERLKDARERAEEDDIVYAIAHASTGDNAQAGTHIERNLRRTIRRKATDSAKKTRWLRKFAPIAAGVAVVLTILFLQYNRLIFAPLMAYVSPGNAPASEIEALDPTITQTVSAEPRLIIPSLNIDVPIRFGVEYSDVMQAMNDGVAHYRIAGASAYPGEIGNFVVTGHSAGDVYTSNPYKYIFSGLERMEDGDLIYVNYNSTRYTYQVTMRQVVEPTNVAALVMDTDKPLITLVTCTPLGTSRYRLLLTGEQISPSYGEASTEESEPVETIYVDEGTEMPANEPSFFERIWNWLTGN